MAGRALHITGSCVIATGSVHKNSRQVFDVAAVDTDGFLLAAYQQFQLNYPKFYKMDNLSKLGWLASEILLDKRQLTTMYQPTHIGVVLSNQNSSLDADVKYWHSVHDVASPSLFVYTLPNIMVGEICIRNGFKGEDAVYITDGFDPQFLHQQVSYLLENDILQCCICGWVDVVGPYYKAALFLVEKTDKGDLFNAEALQTIFDKK